MKLNNYEFEWSNGHAKSKATTLIKATKKLNLKGKKLELGMLVRVRVNGINSWWDSRQFIKHAGLTLQDSHEVKKE